MRTALIFGATSAIAEQVARRLATDGWQLCLAARDSAKLESVVSDLRIRGAARVISVVANAIDYESHESLFRAVDRDLGQLDVLIVAHGRLPDQKCCEVSFPDTLAAFETNALGAFSLLTHAANQFESRKAGTIIVISSVAGDRGRQSNYVYGASKAAIDAFLSGMRNRLYRSGVRVVTVKPGFVDTPMTVSFAKGPLWAKPAVVAAEIVASIDHGPSVRYIPGYWRLIMLVIRLIPESLFKRLHL
jgi:hypothetical protein